MKKANQNDAAHDEQMDLKKELAQQVNQGAQLGKKPHLSNPRTDLGKGTDAEKNADVVNDPNSSEAKEDALSQTQGHVKRDAKEEVHANKAKAKKAE